MATFTLGTYSTAAKNLSKGTRRVQVYESVVDFSATAGGTSVNAGAGAASGSVLSIMKLPAGSTVLAAGINMTIASTTSGTLGIGDASSTTRFGAAAASDTTGQILATTLAVPFTYTADGILSLLVGGATLVVGVAHVWVLVADDTAHTAATTAVL